MYNRIREVRKDAGLSQKEFADRLHLSRNFITLVETNVRNISQRTINDICMEFNVNETWLLDGTGSMHEKLSDEQKIAQVVGALSIKSDVVKFAMITALAHMEEESLRDVLKLIVKNLNERGVDISDLLNDQK